MDPICEQCGAGIEEHAVDALLGSTGPRGCNRWWPVWRNEAFYREMPVPDFRFEDMARSEWPLRPAVSSLSLADFAPERIARADSWTDGV